MTGKLRQRIASNQSLQKARTSLRLEVEGLRQTLPKRIGKLISRVKNFSTSRGISTQLGSENNVPTDLDQTTTDQISAEFLSLLKGNSNAVTSSVIIPVFNKALMTLQCLREISRNVDTAAVEIIIVDNASTDETQKLLSSFEGKVHVIRNESNLGFVEACNIGARSARGEHLIFLNNDTLVQPGWYEALIETVTADKNAGAVGSMLIFPNGTIQEAGGIIWSDANCYAYGRGEDPDDDRFNFAREVDYCSAASLLIKRSLFDDIGGFDMRYAPAYYEDTDLCMEVRAHGYKVLYQPRSRVVHVEGATAGTDTQSGFKRYQSINRTKFAEKWASVLESEHSPLDARSPDKYSNRKKGPKFVVFYEAVPKPLEAAGDLRTCEILQILSTLGQVVLVCLGRNPNVRTEHGPLADLGIELVWMPLFRERFRGGECDVAILCYPLVTNVVLTKTRRYFPNAKIIYDTVDLHFLRYQREYELNGDPQHARISKQYRRIETRLARSVDLVWCITDDEQRTLQQIVPEAHISVVSNVHPIQGPGAPFADRKDLLFIGSFAHRPNKDAMEYFLSDIFPLILKKVPSIKLNIVGSNMPPDLFSLANENVIVHGFVDDPSPLFENCRVFISPLRFGAGLKGKIGLAMSHGLPVVTTSIGAEGFNLRNNLDGLITDRPDEFAELVLRLYSDQVLWELVSTNGIELVRTRFSPEAVSEVVAASIDKMLSR